MEINLDNNILNTKKISCSIKNKKFINCLAENKTIRLNLINVYLPFGKEMYNNKEIVNIELIKTNNIHNNIISSLLSLEERIKKKNIDCDVNILQLLVNKTFLPTIKQSKLGYILRTHINTKTDIYIEKKDKTKFLISNDNLNSSECNVILVLKGIWINHEAETYGLLWDTTEIKINKFNN